MKTDLFKILLLGVALITDASSRAAEVTVFAAASLTDSLKEIAANYEKTSGDKIIFNFGASSTLARQIEDGAPADIFFSADEAQMDRLAKKDLIDPATRKAAWAIRSWSSSRTTARCKSNPPAISPTPA